MAIRETITLNNKKYKRVLKETERETEKYANKQKRAYKKTGDAAQRSSTKTVSSFKKIGSAAKLWIGGAVIGALYGLIRLFQSVSKEALKFDSNIQQSLAIMGDVSETLQEQMKETARSVSENLNISSDKAAKSYYYLASAGFDAKQSVAALPAVAEFAKAGMFDMATATDLATDAQSALGLKSQDAQENLKELTHVTDVLVKANQQANASVQQFSEALTNRAGAQLRAFNKPIEEGVAILADFADQGIKARRAGMFLSRVLRLTAEGASKNTEEFKKLGIIDAEGNLANMADIVQILTERLDGLSDTQQTATLEQLGFTARVQDAIKPLLGTSDAIRRYQASLEDAGGATKEVADNQLTALNEQLGMAWKSVKNDLSEAFLGFAKNVIPTVVTALNSVTDFFGVFDSESQKLIDTLRTLGGVDPELISRLQAQESLNQARDLRKKLQEELSGQNVNVGVSSSVGKSGRGYFDFQKFNLGGLSNQEEIDSALGLLQKKLSDVGKDLIKTAEKASKFKEENGYVSRGLVVQREGLERVRKTLTSQVTKLSRLSAASKVASKNVNDLTESQKELDNQQTDSPDKAADAINNTTKAYKEFINIQRAGGDQIQQTIEKIGKLHDKLVSSGKSGIIGLNIDQAVSDVRKYNKALTEASNELTSGAITQEQYQKRVNDATETYLSDLRAIYNLIKSNLSPEQEKMFKGLFDNFKDANKDTEDFKLKLDDIADTVDAIANVGDAFGSIGENAKDSLRGISDVLRGIQNINDAAGKAGGLGNLLSSGVGLASAAIPAIGIAGGIASIIGSAGARDSKSIQEVESLRTEMVSLKNEIERNTQALLKQGIVGADISQGMIDAAHDAIGGIGQTLEESDVWQALKNTNPGGGLFGTGGQKQEVDKRLNQFINNNLAGFFDQIANSGIDALKGYDLQQFKDLAYSIGGQNLNGQELQKAFDAFINGSDDFIGVNDILKETQDNLGEFGDSLAGASKRLELSDKLGLDPQQGFQSYINNIIGLIGGSNRLTGLLGKVGSTDSQEERKKLANQIWEAYKQNKSILGQNLTESDLEQIINTILGRGGGSSGSSDYSRSTQVANTITEVQANEVLLFLERITQYTKDTAMALNGSAIDAARQYSISNPLPVHIIEPNKSLSGINTAGNNLNIGDLKIESPITDASIDLLMSKLGTKLKQEVRGN